MHPVQTEVVHQVLVEMGQVCYVVQPIRHVRGTKTRVLGNDHVMALRQRFHERKPALRSGGAMQKKQGLTLTPTHESNAASGDCLKCLPVRHDGLGLLVIAARLPIGEFANLRKSVHL
jgi:hypothetical protein